MSSFLHKQRHELAWSMQLDVIGRGNTAAQSACEFIAGIYLENYRARIQPDPDVLIASTQKESGELAACAGISFASQRDRLFSERYIDVPLEDSVFQLTQRKLLREQFVEVGSLASNRPAAAADLIRLLPIVVWHMGAQAIICTATSRLRKLFGFHQIPFDILSNASPERLSADEQAAWGSYYDQSPQTGVILLERCSHLFSQYCGRLVFSEFARFGEPQALLARAAA
ncbi:MAG TPA: thermostable hemolysin [Paraburkholderia sp.]|nr:thermostable hemolysin [Paraburkholderia sp.]